jgi:tRNA threonylcarbamoyl adenosine modification protein YeaZ
MLILGLDAALARCSAAVVADGAVLAERCSEGGRGYATLLPAMAQAVLAAARLEAAALDGVAVTVGPGSFTGLRAALALAHGIGSAAGCPVIGVTVAEALADALDAFPPAAPRPASTPDGRHLWIALDSRRGRVFLARVSEHLAVSVCALDALPPPPGPVAVAGDAAPEVAARLAADGHDMRLTEVRRPLARHVARVGARRHLGELAPCAAQPLYVDPPEARLPAGGLRPPPSGHAGGPAHG